MMQNLYETEETGQNTMIMLNEQGEQLNRIEEGMDNVNNEMKEAEKHLTALEKCCGCFQCKKPVDFEANDKYSSTWNKVWSVLLILFLDFRIENCSFRIQTR